MSTNYHNSRNSDSNCFSICFHVTFVMKYLQHIFSWSQVGFCLFRRWVLMYILNCSWHWSCQIGRVLLAILCGFLLLGQLPHYLMWAFLVPWYVLYWVVLILSFSFSLLSFCFLFQNDYMPPDFLPLLQVIVGNIGNDETESESESSILFQLLSSIMEAGDEKVAVHIPHIVSSIVSPVSKWLTSNLEPWPQVCWSFLFIYWLIIISMGFTRQFLSHNNIKSGYAIAEYT